MIAHGTTPSRTPQRGFSIVELMVAMTVTLIVSAAIYGLLASGSNAFRREPEVADRQQNIRMAMDLVARDVFNAGADLPTFSQVFTVADATTGCTAGLNGCGPLTGTMGAAAAGTRGGGDSEATDVLEIVSTDEQCPQLTVCSNPGEGAAGVVIAKEPVPACLPRPGLALVTNSPTIEQRASAFFYIQPAVAAAGAPCPTGGGSANGNLQVGAPVAQGPSLASLPGGSFNNLFVYRARLVRYRVAPSGDPQDNAPALWRSESGRYDTSGAVALEPGEAGFPSASSPWELVARGIEDLQVEYMAGAGVWSNQPATMGATTGPPTPPNWAALVRQVRITLSARATAGNLQGQTQAGGGAPNAVRGQLSTTVTPRAAFHELQMGTDFQ